MKWQGRPQTSNVIDLRNLETFAGRHANGLHYVSTLGHLMKQTAQHIAKDPVGSLRDVRDFYFPTIKQPDKLPPR